jgi:hypothetical protein
MGGTCAWPSIRGLTDFFSKTFRPSPLHQAGRLSRPSRARLGVRAGVREGEWGGLSSPSGGRHTACQRGPIHNLLYGAVTN